MPNLHASFLVSVNRRFNFTINNFDVGIKKLGEIDLSSKIYIQMIIVL